ncbi:MAG: hypothetical protein HY356_04730 [Gammaproteobacteria bacterium]|nr:hypothetical protein [Gammaproteobacteria bacterium]
MSICAILPLRTQGKKYGSQIQRAEILLNSLRNFAEPDLFKPLRIVIPGCERIQVIKFFDGWRDLNVEIIDEEELLPILKKYNNVGGWHKQQLIKLVGAMTSPTPFVLTLDADVVCTKTTTEKNLIINKRAIIQSARKTVHRQWWLSSAAILGINPDMEKPGMAVTPALLSKHICQSLTQHLGERYAMHWTEYLLSLLPNNLKNFCPDRWKKRKWTEYTLYYLHAVDREMLNTYHIVAGTQEAPGKLVSRNSVWNKTPFNRWDPAICFSASDNSHFTVIQGNKHIDPEFIWARIKPFIQR